MLDSAHSRWMGINNWAGQALYSLCPPILEEGMMLTGGVFENGLQAATITASPTANTPFLGVAFSYYTTPMTAIALETYTIPATGPYTVSTVNTPLNGAAGILVKDANTGSAYGYNATPGAGVYQISGNTLTFNAAQEGATITITYAFTPTVTQAQAYVGDGYPFPVKPSDVTGTIGLIRAGIIYTSNFNPAFDYTTITPGVPLKVGANGIVDPSFAGPIIPNSRIVELPSADTPFLGFYFSC